LLRIAGSAGEHDSVVLVEGFITVPNVLSVLPKHAIDSVMGVFFAPSTGENNNPELQYISPLGDMSYFGWSKRSLRE